MALSKSKILGALVKFHFVVFCFSAVGALADQDDLMPRSKNVVYPYGWNEVLVNMNTARITVSGTAHFDITQNACGHQAYGAIPLEDWNQFAERVNEALRRNRADQEVCFSVHGLKGEPIRQTIQIKNLDRIETLYEVKYGQVCSKMQDRNLLKDLYEAVGRVISVAEKKDCPEQSRSRGELKEAIVGKGEFILNYAFEEESRSQFFDVNLWGDDQSELFRLKKPLESLIFRADCKDMTLDFRSENHAVDSTWEMMPDGSFLVQLQGLSAQFEFKGGSGLATCASELQTEAWGIVDCKDMDRPRIKIELIHWLSKLPQGETNHCTFSSGAYLHSIVAL